MASKKLKKLKKSPRFSKPKKNLKKKKSAIKLPKPKIIAEPKTQEKTEQTPKSSIIADKQFGD